MNTVTQFIESINSTNSNLEKQEILKKYVNDKTVTKVLSYTLDPIKQYNVSSKNVKKYKTNKKYSIQEFKTYTNGFKMLDDLSNRTITGNEALKSVNEYIKDLDEKYQDIVYCILDKNLKIRMNAATVNKVYGKNIIKVFEPVLAKEYDPKFNKLDSGWNISQKLDGVRCLVNVNPVKNTIKAYSRSGKDLHNLEHILKSIPIDKITEPVFLDGEIVYIENGKDDFTKTIEIVRRSKNKDKIKELDNLHYKIFDIIPEEEFYNTIGVSLFNDRYIRLCTIFENIQKIKIVEQVQYTDENFEIMNKKVETLGWEGLMIRDNKPYKGKRTRELCKVKKFHDAEYIVTGVINGPFRKIDGETGLEVTIECLSAVIIDYKDTKVGSGFSIDERQQYYDNPGDIIGKTITVQYFEKTPDSLRFPTFKGIRDYE
jgi:ATP-dependent DNA ligase